MAQDTRPGVPGWYWGVAIVAALWGVAGCASYLMQVSMEAAEIAALPPAQRDMYLSLPAWLTAVFAVAVWVGLSGALGLLLRRRWARTAYAVSLAAIVVQFGWIFLATPILSTIGTSAAAFPAFIAVMGAALLWFADMAAKRGWLR